MSKRVGNRKGKRGRGKHNKQYAHEHGKVLAKRMLKRKLEEQSVDKQMEDKLKGFF